MKRIVLFALALLSLSGKGAAQGIDLLSSPTDPAYISDFSDQLTVRTFLSRKIIGYQVGKQGEQHEAEYSPNDLTSVGVGFSYKFLSLNANFNIPALNNDDEKYGKTKSLDLATYFYLRKFTVDAFVQIYKGHFLSENDILSNKPANRPYLIRPDLQTQFYGVNVQYIFNHSKFSYRAAFLQNEWQRKSAGSFLAGINLHHIRVKADSFIIPDQVYDPTFGKQPELFRQTAMYSVGVDGGYAHTFVLKEHFFTTIALMAGVGGNRTNLSNPDIGLDMSGFGLHLNGTLRLAAGYNSEKWFLGAYYVNFLNRNYAPIDDDAIWQQAANGLYRLVFAHRFAFRQGN
ncbi:MAG: DUF4421 domain-containing protein [Sphingobacteriales bacterium]|nr:MAG: DUF4421 domain-containing protein [Sphingobacteriales bacterium]